MLIAATARGAPEQFYLPREFARLTHSAWQPEYAQMLLDPVRSVEMHRRTPVVHERVAGPNEPCPCGSGRKYKKCHGAVGSAQTA